jgi:hypothetical protein
MTCIFLHYSDIGGGVKVLYNNKLLANIDNRSFFVKHSHKFIAEKGFCQAFRLDFIAAFCGFGGRAAASLYLPRFFATLGA